MERIYADARELLYTLGNKLYQTMLIVSDGPELGILCNVAGPEVLAKYSVGGTAIELFTDVVNNSDQWLRTLVLGVFEQVIYTNMRWGRKRALPDSAERHIRETLRGLENIDDTRLMRLLDEKLVDVAYDWLSAEFAPIMKENPWRMCSLVINGSRMELSLDEDYRILEWTMEHGAEFEIDKDDTPKADADTVADESRLADISEYLSERYADTMFREAQDVLRGDRFRLDGPRNVTPRISPAASLPEIVKMIVRNREAHETIEPQVRRSPAFTQQTTPRPAARPIRKIRRY